MKKIKAFPKKGYRNVVIFRDTQDRVCRRFTISGRFPRALDLDLSYASAHDRAVQGRARFPGGGCRSHSQSCWRSRNEHWDRDAFNLAWKLALVVKGQANEKLLDSYEAERLPFARAILRGSDLGFQILGATKGVSLWLKQFVVPQLFRFLTPLPPVKRRIFWLFSQLWASYRNSPVVAESGPVKQGPRAGDRAPFGVFESGEDVGMSLFRKLRDQDHHLLLFEGKKPAQSQADFPALEARVQDLLNEYQVPIHLHPITAANQSLHDVYRADAPALFLVRPDGHIAYHGSAEDLAGLRPYLDGLFHKSAGSLPAIEIPRVISGSEQPPSASVASTADGAISPLLLLGKTALEARSPDAACQLLSNTCVNDEQKSLSFGPLWAERNSSCQVNYEIDTIQSLIGCFSTPT